jgi:hypothetical protein
MIVVMRNINKTTDASPLLGMKRSRNTITGRRTDNDTVPATPNNQTPLPS